jgi:1-phosphofructokinase
MSGFERSLERSSESRPTEPTTEPTAKYGVRIVTVTLNPAVDQSVLIPNFRPNAVNRVVAEQSDAGGKGVNVAAFLSDYFASDYFASSVASTGQNNCSITATGFLGADNSSLFEQLFQQKKIRDRCLRLPGKTRVNIKIMDDAQAQVTDINFPGVGASDRDLEVLLEAIAALAPDNDWFILSGSLPSGLCTSAYHDLIKPLKAQGKKVVLDTSGEALQEALSAQPSLIKPNVEELRALLGQPLAHEAEIVEAARQLNRAGIETVVVSMGSGGALFVTAHATVHALAEPPVIKSTVGAGDAMVAGTVAALSQGRSLSDCARLATAFSIEALGQVGAHLSATTDWDRACDRVSLRSL